MIFLRRVEVPNGFFPAIAVYFWAGALVMLVDLWRSSREKDTKVLWTILLVIFGIVTFPVYWFRYVLRDCQQV